MSDGGSVAEHERRLAVAREAAEQVAAWQARLVGATGALMETPCDDHWRPYLAWALGLTPAEARELTELVDRLSELPRTREVLASGERSMRTVLAIARRATPDNEETILSSTEAFTGAQLERTLREWARVTAPSERDGEDPETDGDHDDPPPSSASWRWIEGRFRLCTDFDQGDGAALQAWLESERDRIEPAEGESAIVSGHERSCAEALMALGERATRSRTNDVGFAPETITTQVIVHAHENPDGGLVPDRSFMPGIGPVPTWSIQMLAERGPVVTTLMVNGEPVMATTPTRFATAEQRRVLLARDGGCAYPGCGSTRHLIAHHIRPFDEDGPTELRNMCLLCRRHHRLVHRLGIRITPDPEAPPGRFLWRFSDSSGEPMRPACPSTGQGAQHLLRTRRRRTGDGEPLTGWGLGVIIEHWLRHQAAPATAAA